MTVLEARRLFGFQDYSPITNEMVKKVYRKKIRENHPDRGGCENEASRINEAYALLKKEVQCGNKNMIEDLFTGGDAFGMNDVFREFFDKAKRRAQQENTLNRIDVKQYLDSFELGIKLNALVDVNMSFADDRELLGEFAVLLDPRKGFDVNCNFILKRIKAKDNLYVDFGDGKINLGKLYTNRSRHVIKIGAYTIHISLLVEKIV